MKQNEAREFIEKAIQNTLDKELKELKKYIYAATKKAVQEISAKQLVLEVLKEFGAVKQEKSTKQLVS